MKKIRAITNWLADRSRTMEEALDIDGTKRFLESLDGGTRGTIVYSDGRFSGRILENISPRDMAKFLGERFAPRGTSGYLKISHEVYSGRSRDKHYLDLENGLFFGGNGAHGRPDKIANVRFFVEKEAPEMMRLGI